MAAAARAAAARALGADAALGVRQPAQGLAADARAGSTRSGPTAARSATATSRPASRPSASTSCRWASIPRSSGPGLEPLALPPGPGFRFLFVGGTIFRKGIDLLLAAYARAFRPADGVGLVIKDMGIARASTAARRPRREVAGLRERGYPVEYIDRDLTEPEMAGLYAACDCLVHPFRGEGFALPVVEAMACGLPVIVTGAGPVLDYATDETAFLIPARRGQFAECRVGDLETIGRPWLLEPDLDALVEHPAARGGRPGGGPGQGGGGERLDSRAIHLGARRGSRREPAARAGRGDRRGTGARIRWAGSAAEREWAGRAAKPAVRAGRAARRRRWTGQPTAASPVGPGSA